MVDFDARHCEQLDMWLLCALLCGGLRVVLSGFTEEGVSGLGGTHPVSALVVGDKYEGIGFGGGDWNVFLVLLLRCFCGLRSYCWFLRLLFLMLLCFRS